MVKIIPYLLVSNGKEAISLYKTIFNAQLITHQPFSSEIVEQMGYSEDYDYENSTMHAEMQIGGSKIYLADNNQGTKDYGHVEITLELESENQIKEIYKKAIKNKCEPLIELKEYEWGFYTRVKDTFGVVWQLNYVPSQ
jgi:PhnB protein